MNTTLTTEQIAMIGLTIQALSLIFLVVYVVKTWEMASATLRAAKATEMSVAEIKEARDQETAPYVVAYFEIQAGSSLIVLVIKNIGKTVASNVVLDFTPELKTSLSFPVAEVSFIKNGISSMPPNFEMRTIVDSTFGLFNNTTLPTKYGLRIAYNGGIGNITRIQDQVLDLAAQKGAMLANSENLGNLVDEVKTLNKAIDIIGESLRESAATLRSGIYISNPALSVSFIGPELTNWYEHVAARLREYSIEWAKTDAETRYSGARSETLKRHMVYVSGQVTLLLANRPSGLPEELVSRIVGIATRLIQNGAMKFYIDGGASIERFNAASDDIAKEIDLVIPLLDNAAEQLAHRA